MIPSDIITKADRQKVRNGPVVSVENIKSNNNNKNHQKKQGKRTPMYRTNETT